MPQAPTEQAPAVARDNARRGVLPPSRSAAGLTPILLPVAVAVAIGAIFISVYLAAFHAPVPRDLPVAVVGTTAQAAAVTERLPGSPADAFRVERSPDEAGARSAVEHGEVFAAYLPADPHGPAGGGPRLLYAGAHGPSVTTLLLQSFGEVARAGGEELRPLDVVPPSPQDTRGLVVFYTTFGLVLAGYLYGIMTYQLAPGVTMGRRMASLAAFSGVGGIAVAAIVAAYDALPAPFPGVAGLVALVALAVGSSTMLLVRGLGVIGSSIAAVLFMTVGNATSGGSLPTEFLPGWLEPFSAALPVGVGVRAVNGLAYFHGEGVAGGVAILTAWALAGVGGLLLLERSRRRALGLVSAPRRPESRSRP
ncbi:ABC transporter permease [Streptomyces sp. NPDC055078]